MIWTAKSSTQKQSLPDKKSNLKPKQQKPKLVARWKTVDGQLICQWVTE